MDKIDFLSFTKRFECNSEFIDQESVYVDTDYMENYELGDEKMFALLAAQSGVNIPTATASYNSIFRHT